MIASLALSGAATAAVLISTAHAQPTAREPMMLAQADTPGADTPGADNRGLGRRGNRPARADMAQRLNRLCQDMVARQTGDLAYLETRLNLTSSQQPLFQRWKDAKLTIARRHADQCSRRMEARLAERQQNQAPQPGQNMQDNDRGPAERMAQEEDRLKQRLADIGAERPALEAFYNVLSSDQKMAFERTGMRGRGMMRGRRIAFAGGPREMMNGTGMGPGMGLMGRPPMPPPGGPEAPPPAR